LSVDDVRTVRELACGECDGRHPGDGERVVETRNVYLLSLWEKEDLARSTAELVDI
jgi:hypothetical protein